MLNRIISRNEANTYLKQVCNLCVIQLDVDKSGVISIGFGRLFEISYLSVELETAREIVEIVPQFQLCSYSDVTLMDSNGNTQKIIFDDETTISQIETQIVDKRVSEIFLDDQNTVIIRLCECDIEALSIAANWKIYQPKTEEDRLQTTHGHIFKQERLQRRWSEKFCNERNEWHPFPLEHKPPNAMQFNKKSVKHYLKSLVDSKLIYGLKSPDMNLFDFGFIKPQKQLLILNKENPQDEQLILHSTCAVMITDQSGESTIFYGDCDKNKFQNTISNLIDQCVMEVSLEIGNELIVRLENASIKLFSADDEEESWRFFYREEARPHLIVANTWRIFEG